ncbi:hypothetical protein DFH06DRAFT_1335346 [Mycena polygramma]|nr:hypothetical protein DFH06DRAFT_1335346 [Mycena polygramma]
MDISTDHPTTPADQPPPGSTSTDSSMTAAPQSPPPSSVPLKRPREEDDDGTAHKVQPRAVHTGQAMEKIAALEAENYARKAAMDLNESTVRSLNAKLEEVHGHCTRWELLVQQLTTELADCSTVPEDNTELETRLEEANAQIDLLYTESEDLSDQVADLIGDLKKSEQELESARSLIRTVEEEKRKISKHNDDLTAAAVAHQDTSERIQKLDEELLNTQRELERMQTNYNTLQSDMDAKIEDAVKIQYNEMKRNLEQNFAIAEEEREGNVTRLTNMSDTFKASLEARIRELEAENTHYKFGEERHRWAENFVKFLSKDNASLKAALATANANLQQFSAFHQNQAKAPGSEDIPMPDAGLDQNGPSFPSSTYHQPSMGQPTSSPSAHQQTGPTSSSTTRSTNLPASRPSDRDVHMVGVEPAPSNPQQSGSSSAPQQSSSSAPQQSTSSTSQQSGSSNPQQSGSPPQQDVPTSTPAPSPNTPPNTPPNNTSAGTSQFGRNARSTPRRPAVAPRRTPKPPRTENEKQAITSFRNFIKLRLKIKNDQDVRSLKLVTIEHAAASKPGKNDIPLALVMDDTTNDWNHSVGVILIEAFRLEHQDTTVSVEFLTEQWGKRLVELKKNHKALANLSPEAVTGYLAAKAVGSRRTTNRTQLLMRRNDAWQLSDLAEEVKVHFAVFFNAMSGQCMSSDEEEDPPSRTKVVRVLRKDWRASDLISLLKWLDYYYHHSLLNSHGVKQGGGTRSRIRSALPGKASDRPVISGLPSNFYNSVWLAQQSAAQLQKLKVLPPVDLPMYVLTWPTNSMFQGDPNDHDEYWKPPKRAL